jgi:predicted nuclease with TOPRIM domain
MPTNVQLAQAVETLQTRLGAVQASNSRLKDELYESRQNTVKLENRVRKLEEKLHTVR